MISICGERSKGKRDGKRGSRPSAILINGKVDSCTFTCECDFIFGLEKGDEENISHASCAFK